MESDKIEPPDWCLEDPRFKELFEDRDVFSEGNRVWVPLSKRNGKLFSPGPDDLSASSSIVLMEKIDSNPQLIERVAKGLFSLKGSKHPRSASIFGQ